ncbi:MAG: hypothetical protein EXQ58_11075 [Acidobacteria bacterium]|nr:hypothetical protein [Acidobacteriota bacterium]
MKRRFVILSLPLLLLALHQLLAAGSVMNTTPAEPSQPVEEIVSKMVARSRWQDAALREYGALRRFRAANLRFNCQAFAEVLTSFRKPDFLDSSVVKREGSQLIHDRVFEKILEAEKEMRFEKQKAQSDIFPENYDFAFAAVATCEGRPCYQLRISPKRKDKYLLNGSVWVDSGDYGIARVQGVPTKRHSFWTLHAEIDRRYRRIGQLWLPDRIDSVSNIFLAGHSTLSIEYLYQQVQGDPEFSHGSRGAQATQ